jgi:LuxR family quorum-sensing system transcriptional regulator CciR
LVTPSPQAFLAPDRWRAPLAPLLHFGRAQALRRLVDRFGEKASTCASVEELRLLLEAAAFDLGFDHFALLHHASLGAEAADHVRIDNYPGSWVEEILATGLAAHDPVHVASRRCLTGFAWSELGSIIPLDVRHQAILARSRMHGLGEGFTVPANVPGEPSGSCSFAVRQGVSLPRERLRCAELVGAHAFGAARRILELTVRAERPRLSRRETECVRLIAIGKTDWEIARILGLSIETVRQYVKRARAAYDVVTRTQLVVHGLRDDWLSLSDAAPLPKQKKKRSIPPSR